MSEKEFAGRCLDFDAATSKNYAAIVAGRPRHWQPISIDDVQTAAITLAAGLMAATRNIKDFGSIDGLTLADPWQTPLQHYIHASGELGNVLKPDRA